MNIYVVAMNEKKFVIAERKIWKVEGFKHPFV
jgi:hypothetical protein